MRKRETKGGKKCSCVMHCIIKGARSSQGTTTKKIAPVEFSLEMFREKSMPLRIVWKGEGKRAFYLLSSLQPRPLVVKVDSKAELPPLHVWVTSLSCSEKQHLCFLVYHILQLPEVVTGLGADKSWYGRWGNSAGIN